MLDVHTRHKVWGSQIRYSNDLTCFLNLSYFNGLLDTVCGPSLRSE